MPKLNTCNFLGRCSSEFVKVIPLSYSLGTFAFLIDCMIFSVTILHATSISMATISFLVNLDWNIIDQQDHPMTQTLTTSSVELIDIFYLFFTYSSSF